MKACIHRGARQIGGTAVELEFDGARLLLDLGLPLDAESADPSLLPEVSGLSQADPSLLGVVLSHGHQDHWGLLPTAQPDLPVFAGEATERMQAVAARMFDRAAPFKAAGYLRHRRPMMVGPFKVTPYLSDHSAFDAYSLLVEAGGRRLFYSGDVRAHGRKGRIFESLVNAPPGNVDTMLLEGSVLGRLAPEARFETEDTIEARLLVHFKASTGLALVAASPQNVDRVVSIYRAGKKSGRRLVLDLYAAEVLEATGNSSIPSLLFEDVRFYLPWRQARWVKSTEGFHFINTGGRKAQRVYSEEFMRSPTGFVVLVNGNFLSDQRFTACLKDGRAVWSQWDGYLRPGGHGARMAERLAAFDVPLEVIHTSGHADVPSLQRLAAAIAPRRLTPIHTFFPERFAALFSNVVQRHDGEWWEV